MSDAAATLPAGRYDEARRRKARRSQRQRGCWVYIPAAELLRAGLDPTDDPPYYRVWGQERGGVLVRLYREP